MSTTTLRYVRVWPRDPDDPSWRLRLEFPSDRELDDVDLASACVVLVDERVLPEQLLNPDARRVDEIGSIALSRDDIERLHTMFGELLQQIPRKQP